MTEPKLMPFQDQPFNGDTFIEQEFIALRDRFNITTAIETGTALGYTTLWLAKNFEKVYTIELNKQYVDIARAKFLQYPNITSIHGNSEDIVKHLRIDGNALFFLDAHWGNNCPLLGELYGISKLGITQNTTIGEVLVKGIKPVIAIHDFLVPDEGEVLGYDQYKGQPFKLDWIKPALDKIYGEANYGYNYNSHEKSAGARRGIIYIWPL